MIVVNIEETYRHAKAKSICKRSLSSFNIIPKHHISKIGRSSDTKGPFLSVDCN